jgi:hypothetical protein
MSPSHDLISRLVTRRGRRWRRDADNRSLRSSSGLFIPPVGYFSCLRGRRTGRGTVLARAGAVSVSGLLELDTVLLLTGCLLGTEVTIVLGVG